MALFRRIWIAVSVVNLAVLALFVLLSTLQFDSINSSLVGERLGVLAARTSAPFVAAARIGLPLATVRNAEALLERARQTDDAISAIHVFDADGTIVHSTDKAADPTIPAEANGARSAAGGKRWHIETTAGFYSGVDVANARGERVGGVLVVYPARLSVTRTRAMLEELGIAAIAVVLVSAALSALLLRIGLSRQIATFESIEDQISGFERGAWRSAAGASAAPDRPGDLRALLDAAEARYRREGHALAAADSRGGPGGPG